MGWSITPTTGVQNPDAQDGKYIFIPQLNDTTYTITYKDDKGLEGTIQYTVKSTDCMVCDCNKFTLIPRVDTIPGDGYTTDTVIATINGYCVANGKTMDSYLNPVIVSGADMVKSISTAYTDDYTVSVYAKINPNPGDTRKFKIRFDIVNSYMVVKQSCDAGYEFTQAPNHCYVKDAPDVTPNIINDVPSEGNDYSVTFDTTECWELEYPIIYDQEKINFSEEPYNFTVLDNNTEYPRQITITYNFKNTVSGQIVPKPVEINQLANECVNADEPYACFDIIQAECAVYRTSDAAQPNIPVKFINLGNCWRYKDHLYEGKVVGVTADENGSIISITSNTDPSEATSKVHYNFEKIMDTSITAESIVKIIQSVNDCITAPEPTVCLDMMQSECTAYTATTADEMQVTAKFENLGNCWAYKTYGKSGNVKQNGVTVEGNNSTISLSANTSASEVDSRVYYTFRNDTRGVEVTKEVKITQPAGCTCTCSDIKKEFTENNEEVYTYTTSVQVDVPFAILSMSNTKDCKITPNKKHEGITSIGCKQYISSDPTLSEELKTYCNGIVSQNKKVYIIYGTISECEDTPRALGFTYTVCNNECTNTGGKPFYVYQRCACGMDNCRTEYKEGSTVITVQDRPLYIGACNNEWANGDTIYVNYLEILGAALFNVNTNREKMLPAVATYTLPNPIWIRNEHNTTECEFPRALHPKIKFNCQYDADACANNGNWDGTISGIKCNTVSFGELGLSAFTLSNHAPKDPAGNEYFGMMEYAVSDATKSNDYERLLEVYYKTDGGNITGGVDYGKCASEFFTVSIMIARKGYGYVRVPGQADDELCLMKKCCYCGDDVTIKSISGNTQIPKTPASGQYIEICRVTFNENVDDCKISLDIKYDSGSQFVIIATSKYERIDNTNTYIITAMVEANPVNNNRTERFILTVNGFNCGDNKFNVTQLG